MFKRTTSITQKWLPVLRAGLFSLSLLVAAQPVLIAQTVSTPAACVIRGADSLPGGTVASYSLKGCQATAWRLSCGTISSQTDSTVTISLNTMACSGITLMAMQGSSPIATKTVKLGSVLAVNGGVITTSNQTVPIDSLPKQLTASAATQGVCNGVYAYQWYRSTDSVHFQPIPGATGRHYQPGPVDSTTYLKRQTTCSGSAVFTNTVTIHVNPRLYPGSILPGVQMLNPDSLPGALTLSGVSGGAGSYTYQWQSATESRPRVWRSIPGANTATYRPVSPDSTTHYRVRLASKGDTGYSAEAVIGIYPPLFAGAVSPAVQTVAADTIPTLLSLAGATGGNGTFAYQWYSSADGSSWTLLQGVTTAGFSPGQIAGSTYYRVAISSNGLTATSAAAIVTVNSPAAVIQ